MSGRWYYRQGTNEYGPLAWPHLVQLIQGGQLAPHDWVREGEANPWRQVQLVPELIQTLQPAAAPVARPVAAPVAVPAAAAPVARPAAPVARAPLAAAPVARPAVPVAPVAAAAPVAPVMPIAPAPASKSKLVARRKKSSPALMITLVTCIGGAAVLLLMFLVMNSGEAEPVAADDDAAPVASADGDAPNDLSRQRQSMIAAIQNWREAGRVTGGVKNVLSFDVERLRWKGGEGSELVVELTLNNLTAGPLVYESWNSTGPHGALLVDEAGKIVATAAGSGQSRQLPAGETITEVLEFKTDVKEVDRLRLVLPYSAIDQRGQWGYALNRAILEGSGGGETSIAKGDSGEKGDGKTLNIEVPGISKAGAKAPTAAADGEPEESLMDQIKRSVRNNPPPTPKFDDADLKMKKE